MLCIKQSKEEQAPCFARSNPRRTPKKECKVEKVQDDDGKKSNAVTHVDILSQQLVRGLVLLENVVVHGAASEGASKEET